MDNALLPCPFCNGSLEKWGASAFIHPKGKCILSGRKFAKGFIGQWNTRATPAREAVEDMVEALEGLVANLDEGDFISTTRIEEARAALAKAKGGS